MESSNVLSSNVAPINGEYLKISEEVSKNNEMDKDAFIQLLVTQMKYQDPLEPMDNSEMLAQLAQFTALEQMMNVANVSQKQLANTMIGKYVEYQYTDTNSGAVLTKVGKVDYVSLNGETPILGIGGDEVKLEDVFHVISGENLDTNSSAFDVIGKVVQAKVKEKMDDGSEKEVVIEGEVKEIHLKEGKPYVVIGSKEGQYELPYENVQNIVESASITGRMVQGTYKDEAGEIKTISGTAEYIKITDKGTYIYVEGKLIDFKDITLVK